MHDIDAAVENLARAFYEVDGEKWEAATEFVREAVRTHIAVGLMNSTELLDMIAGKKEL